LTPTAALATSCWYSVSSPDGVSTVWVRKYTWPLGVSALRIMEATPSESLARLTAARSVTDRVKPPLASVTAVPTTVGTETVPMGASGSSCASASTEA
jgi:hypothetical protein